MKANCEKCSCPMVLLKLEKRRWETRKICARCGEAKVSGPTLLDVALEQTGRGGLRAAIMRMPVVKVTKGTKSTEKKP